MLTDYPVSATLPASNIDRARKFYADKLGLTPVHEDPGGIEYRCAESTRFVVYPTTGVSSGTHTQVSWVVANLDSEVAALKARGVVFEEYVTPPTVKGIATLGPVKAAWFKDSEGNLLGLIQFT